jgi:CopG family nickel-responsive transcriptional regulator
MPKLIRFGVAVEGELLSRFDRLLTSQGYVNRSEALRDLMRERLVEDEWRSDEETAGVVILVYDHAVRELPARLTDTQHELCGKVISTLHVHLDSRHCLEVILARGRGAELGRFADRLIGLKGVVYGKLVPATLGHGLWEEPAHHHRHDHEHEHAAHTSPPAPEAARRTSAERPRAPRRGPPKRPGRRAR